MNTSFYRWSICYPYINNFPRIFRVLSLSENAFLFLIYALRKLLTKFSPVLYFHDIQECKTKFQWTTMPEKLIHNPESSDFYVKSCSILGNLYSTIVLFEKNILFLTFLWNVKLDLSYLWLDYFCLRNVFPAVPIQNDYINKNTCEWLFRCGIRDLTCSIPV